MARLNKPLTIGQNYFRFGDLTVYAAPAPPELKDRRRELLRHHIENAIQVSFSVPPSSLVEQLLRVLSAPREERPRFIFDYLVDRILREANDG